MVLVARNIQTALRGALTSLMLLPAAATSAAEFVTPDEMQQKKDWVSEHLGNLPST